VFVHAFSVSAFLKKFKYFLNEFGSKFYLYIKTNLLISSQVIELLVMDLFFIFTDCEV
jgi:hypothetical protein